MTLFPSGIGWDGEPSVQRLLQSALDERAAGRSPALDGTSADELAKTLGQLALAAAPLGRAADLFEHRAGRLLARLPPAAAEPATRELLADENPLGARCAGVAGAAGMKRPLIDAPAGTVIHLLHAGPEACCVDALDALRRMGGATTAAALPDIASLLSRDRDSACRTQAITTLGEMGEIASPAVDTLVAACARDGGDDALEAIAAIAPDDPRAIEAVAIALQRPQLIGRPVRVLGDVLRVAAVPPQVADRMVSALVRHLGDAYFGDRQAAASALARLGEPARRAIPALRGLLQREPDERFSDHVCAAAARAIARLSPTTDSAVAILSGAFGTCQPEVEELLAAMPPTDP